MTLCREAAAGTPHRPRPLPCRRPLPSAASIASAASTSSSATAATRRRTASASNGGELGNVDATPTKNQLKAFAAAMNKPVSSQETRRSFDLLRALLPHRFAELCTVHLSFLIDVPPDFLDAGEAAESRRRCRGGQQQQHQTPGKWLRQHVRNSMKMKLIGGRTDASMEVPASTSDLAVVESLLVLLAPHAAVVEGLFRKCGSACRQRRLLDSLRGAAGGTPGATAAAAAAAADAASGCSPHDFAGALKASLAVLTEPLLTDRLLPYFQQVARLGAASAVDDAADEGRSAILAARRLKGFRLLVQLLPADRRALLGRLLTLLGRTGAAPDTRMTPESLGTVLGPALFYPRAADDVAPDAAADCLGGARHHAVAPLNLAVAFLVRHADAVLLVPDSIARDADQILRRIGRSPAVSASASSPAGPEDVVSLSVRFADRAAVGVTDADGAGSRRRRGAAPHDDGDFTRAQVAALYAAVQAMPDSAKRRRLIRRFNRTNGGLATAAEPPPPAAGTNDRSPSVASSEVSSLSPPQLQSPSPSHMPPLISSPVSGRLFDFPMRCLSPDADV